MVEAIGWAATFLFACSYFFSSRQVLQVIQASSALLWVGYGFIIQSMPVVIANVIIISAAIFVSLRNRLVRQEG